MSVDKSGGECVGMEKCGCGGGECVGVWLCVWVWVCTYCTYVEKWG